MTKYILFSITLFLFVTLSAQKINREALVKRHTVVNTKADSLTSLSVGNGKFAFTVDITGLQSFPQTYAQGISLGTQSEWGWHSFTDTSGYRFEESLKEYDFNGKKSTYAVQWNEQGRNKNAADWFRQNPHRLQLGNLGFELFLKDGSIATISDIKNIRQELNMWTGEIKSSFTVDGSSVKVSTFAHGTEDVIGAKVESPLIKEGRLTIRLRFPYPTGAWTDYGTNWSEQQKHQSSIQNKNKNSTLLLHQLDNTKYYAAFNWKGSASIAERGVHDFLVAPNENSDSFEFSCRFSPEISSPISYSVTAASSIKQWKNFWNSGGVVDFSESTDNRAFEIERRIVLSQYLTRLQCAGSFPPQETGLTYNSWFGKPHLEMHWWHGVHFALWGRPELLEKSMSWYAEVADEAKKLAQRQGFEGIRWQKMVSHAGDESPSSVGSFLIWQQPHFIYFAELLYRHNKENKTLEKYKDLVFATADFMASFPTYNKENDRYVLGKGVIPAQERFKPGETFNPTFELAYWHWALNVAQEWREKSGLERNKKWDEVLLKLSPLPKKEGVYLATESAQDSYTNPEYKTDHPAVLGAYGILPLSKMLDTTIMRQTFDLVWNTWHWDDTWGWDFPMTAMTATRLGLPEKAIEALLMKIRTNTYLPNGHNYQDERLRLYLPGNGGLLTAIAMMVAGYDGTNSSLPGIPKDGKWKVRWEGLEKMP